MIIIVDLICTKSWLSYDQNRKNTTKPSDIVDVHNIDVHNVNINMLEANLSKK